MNIHKAILACFPCPRLYEISILEIHLAVSSVRDAIVRKAEKVGKREELVVRRHPSMSSRHIVGRTDKTVYEKLWWTLKDCGVDLRI